LLSWRYLGPRLVPKSYEGDPRKLWKVALLFTGVNTILMIPGSILYVMWSWTGIPLTLALLFILFGGVSLIFFATTQVRRLGITTKQGIRAYVITTLTSNSAYLVLVLAYAKLTSII